MPDFDSGEKPDFTDDPNESETPEPADEPQTEPAADADEPALDPTESGDADNADTADGPTPSGTPEPEEEPEPDASAAPEAGPTPEDEEPDGASIPGLDGGQAAEAQADTSDDATEDGEEPAERSPLEVLAAAERDADASLGDADVGDPVARCESRRLLFLYLEAENGMPIPEAAYEITLADLSVRSGRLDREGSAVLEDPPQGPFELQYPDLDDVKAKSLAARIRKACSERDVDEIESVLTYSSRMLNDAVTAYARYFDDLSAQGMLEDIQDAVTDELSNLRVQVLLARAGLKTRKPIVYFPFGEIEYSTYEGV